jgi:hypothetical protein
VQSNSSQHRLLLQAERRKRAILERHPRFVLHQQQRTCDSGLAQRHSALGHTCAKEANARVPVLRDEQRCAALC